MSVVAPEFLFHGSASVFLRPDVQKGRGYKDFGKGFYMSVDSAQAIGMMHKKFAEISSLRLLKPERLGVQWFVSDQSVADRLIKKFERVDWRDFQ